jgi:hypothetical protein
VIKEHTQIPIIIAARHMHVDMMKFLVSKGQSLSEDDPNHDALSVSFMDRRAQVLVCLLEN